jgi:hypothetical protein
MCRFLCCLLFFILAIPLLLAYLICAMLAAIFGQPEKCKPILDKLNKLSRCCNGKD